MSSAVCPTCGTPVPAAAGPAGCPRCVARVLLGELNRGDAPGREEAEASDALPVLGGYEIIEEIARGGMGIVYRARQPGLEREVALKVILAGPFAGAESIARLRVEAAAAARLQHPGIVGIYEIGEASGHHFISMEFVRGRTLAELTREGPLPAKRAASYVEQVARAVQYAHEQGVYHRDLKPSNILVGADDRPRVTDFGLAKQVDRDESLTLTGQALGTPSFAAPEQLDPRRGEVTVRSDVYGLGALLYHLLVGRPPFLANSITETIEQVVNSEPVAPRLANRSTPRDLDTLVLRCLGKEAHRRYATAGEVAEELERWREGRPILARPVGPLARGWRWCRRRPAVATALATVLVAGLVILMAIPALVLNQQRMLESRVRSLLSAAHAVSASGRPGQRFDALEAIGQAVVLKPAAEVRGDLRNEAIAALTRPDIRRVRELTRPAGETWTVLPELGKCLVLRGEGFPVLRELDGGGREVLLDGVPRVESITGIADGGRLVFARMADGREEWNWADRDERRMGGRMGRPGWLAFRPLENRVAFVRHRIPVSHPVVSADGQRLAIFVLEAGGGEVLAIHQVSDGRMLRRFRTEFRAQRIAWSPDGRALMVSSQQTSLVLIVDAETGRVRHRWRAPASVAGIAWHPDGRRVAGGCVEGSLFLWQPGYESEARVRPTHHNAALAVQFTPDGELLLSSGWDRQICLSDPTNLEPLLAFPTTATAEPVLSREGTRLWSGTWPSADAAGVVAEFELALPRELRWRRQPDEGRRQAVVDHPEDRRFSFDASGVLLASADRTGVSIWQVPSGVELARVPAPRATMPLFHPSGDRLFVAGAFGVVEWPIRRGTERMEIGPPVDVSTNGNSQNRAMVAASARGNRLVFSSADALKFLTLDARRPAGTTPSELDPLFLALNAAADTVAWAGWGSGTILSSVPSGAQLVRLTDAMSPAFHPASGRFLIRRVGGEENGDSWFWTAVRGDSPPARLMEASDTLWTPAFGREGRTLAMASPRGGWVLLSTAGGMGHERRLAAFTSFIGEGECTAIAVSPDDAWVATRRGPDLVQWWDVRRIRAGLARLGLDWDGAPPEVKPGGSENSTLWQLVLDRPPPPRRVRDRLGLIHESVAREASEAGASGAKDRTAVQWVTVPIRVDPRFHPLDLGGATNAALAPAWFMGESPKPTADLRDLPVGLADYQGTPFDVRGVIQVGGYRAEGRRYPVRVAGLPVGRTCGALQFLHAHPMKSLGPWVAFGRYVIRYVDGTEVHLPLTGWESVGSMMAQSVGGYRPEAASPLSRAVWQGRRSPLEAPTLYRYVWQNPRPTVAIQDIDIVADDPEIAHFLVALTAEVVAEKP